MVDLVIFLGVLFFFFLLIVFGIQYSLVIHLFICGYMLYNHERKLIGVW